MWTLSYSSPLNVFQWSWLPIAWLISHLKSLFMVIAPLTFEFVCLKVLQVCTFQEFRSWLPLLPIRHHLWNSECQQSSVKILIKRAMFEILFFQRAWYRSLESLTNQSLLFSWSGSHSLSMWSMDSLYWLGACFYSSLRSYLEDVASSYAHFSIFLSSRFIWIIFRSRCYGEYSQWWCFLDPLYCWD